MLYRYGVFLLVFLFPIALQSQLKSTGADNSSNYSTWSDGDNGGTGFGAWEINGIANGGTLTAEIGSTGLSASSFKMIALYNGGSNHPVLYARRGFSKGNLEKGDVISLYLARGQTINIGSIYSVRLLSNDQIMWSITFTGGNSNWNVQDGAGSRSISQSFNGNTPYQLSFSLEGNNKYSFAMGSHSESGVTSINSLASIDEIEFYVTYCANTTPPQHLAFDSLSLGSNLVSSTESLVLQENLTTEYLEIEAGGSLQVDPGYTLTAKGQVVNNGTFSLKSVYDNSGANHSTTASLYQTEGSIYSGTGSFSMERNTGDIADHHRYQYWGSPVSNTTMGTVFTGSNSNDFYTWDESLAGGNLAGGQWVSVSSSTTMVPGRGYATTPSTGNTSTFNETRTFSGTPNNGDVVVNLNNPGDYDFIFLSNPYPSAIDAQEFSKDNSHQGNYYFWNQATAPTGYNGTGTNNSGDYASYNSTGGTSGNGGELPTQYIASGQGFFIQGWSGMPLSYTFKNAHRVAGENGRFFKTSLALERAWINLFNEEGNFNQILLGLEGSFSESFDLHYDAPKFKGNPYLAFYAMGQDNDYAIMAWPKRSGRQWIPLGLDAAQTGVHTFQLDSSDAWPAQRAIYLVDSLLGQTVDLQQSDYSFVVHQAGSERQRFYLLLDDQPIGQLESPQQTPPLIYLKEQVLHFDFRQSDWLYGSYTLHDLNGRLLQQGKLEFPTQAQSLSHLPPGMYLVHLESKRRSFTQKLILQ